MKIRLITKPAPVVNEDTGFRPARKGEQYIRLDCLSGDQRRNLPQRRARRVLASAPELMRNKDTGGERPSRFAWNTAIMVEADIVRGIKVGGGK